MGDDRAIQTSEDFASFMRASGHRVLKSESSYWFDASFGFFLSCPSHRLIEPSGREIRDLMRRRLCLGVRFAGPASGPGKASYQIVCEDREYSIESLSANTRSKVRRGLRRCEVGPASFDELARGGRAADADTLGRQGRRARVSGERWDRFWRSAAGRPGIEAWAARSGADILAFLVTVQFDESVEFLMTRSRTGHGSAYANNALIFHVAEEMLARRGVPRITFGLESLEPVEALDQFKIGMGFRHEPLKQRVLFHPWIDPLVRRPQIRSLLYRWARRPGPESTFWRKTAGLVRFAEEAA